MLVDLGPLTRLCWRLVESSVHELLIASSWQVGLGHMAAAFVRVWNIFFLLIYLFVDVFVIVAHSRHEK